MSKLGSNFLVVPPPSWISQAPNASQMYLKRFKYNMVPKLIGSEVGSITTTHRVKPLKYVHIDMNLNFMHILAFKNFMELPYILDQIK